jgi:diguanylate cyclase (GGDEF)-like protein
MGKMPTLSSPHQRQTAPLLLALLGFGSAGLMLGHWWARASVGGVDPLGGGEPLPWLLGGVLLALAAVALLFAYCRGAADGRIREPGSGLYLREHADDYLLGQIAREERLGASRLALVLIRVDYLDRIRRNYGDVVARQVVDLVGRQVCGQTRDGDLPVRHAADVLAVYLDCDEIEQALAFGRRISMLLMNQQLESGGDVIKVDVSLGIALRAPGEELESLFSRAERGFQVSH